MKKTVGVFARRYNHRADRPFGLHTDFFESLSRDNPDLGIDFNFFSVDTWKKDENTIDTLQFDGHQWSQKRAPIPNVIFDRFFSNKELRSTASAFRKFLQRNNAQFTTSLDLAKLTGNKSKFNQFLERHRLPCLRSIPFKQLTENQLQTLLAQNGKVYLKPYSGLGGSGIVVIEKLQQLWWQQHIALHSLNKETVTLKTRQLLPALKNHQNFNRYIAQPDANAYGFENSPVCVRVLVQNQDGKNYSVTGKIARVGAKKAQMAVPGPEERALPLCELADYYRDTYQKDIFEETAQVDEICLRCCDKLYEKFGDFLEIGFDVMLTKNQGPIILEANSKPGRTIFGKLADAYPEGSKEEVQHRATQRESMRRPAVYINSFFSKHH